MTQQKPIPADLPILLSKFLRIDASLELEGSLRFDGSHDDYWEYLRRLERLFEGTHTDAVAVGTETYVRIPPIHLQFANARYWLRQHPKAPFYLLNSEVRDALLNTDLTWIDADAFRALPDVMGIIVSPVTDDLQLFHQTPHKDWHCVSDITLFRIKDSENRSRVANRFNLSPDDPDNQFFYWMANSRDTYDQGSVGTNWSVFPVTTHMKLDDLAEGVDRITKEIAQQDLIFGEDAERLSEDPALARIIQDNRIMRESMRADAAQHDSQVQSLVNCTAFLAKAALLYNCEWFQSQLVQLPPPGLKSMPHKAAKLYGEWGWRYRVVLPKHEDSEESETSTTHAKRTRHWVRGFFRNQPYGTGRALRRIKWVRPHWRGVLPLA